MEDAQPFETRRDFIKAQTRVKNWHVVRVIVGWTLATVAYVVLLIISGWLALAALAIVAILFGVKGARLLWRKDREMRELKSRVEQYRRVNGL
jgi:uncharacterized membrane protein